MSVMKHGISIGIERVDQTIFLSLKVVGTLTHEDYEIVTPMLEAAISSVKAPKVDVLVDASELTGFELRAIWDDFKLGLKHNNEFNKIAMVGHSRWQELLVKMSRWFIAGEAQYFKSLAEAIDWLNESGTDN